MIPKITLEEHFISEAVRNSPSVSKFAFHKHPPDVVEKLFEIGDGRILDMNDGEISLQVVSSIPALEPADVCRRTNLQLAEAIRKNPSRLAGFASLPMGDPDAAIAELEFCVKELEFVGTLIPNHANGTFYDGKEYYGFWERAQQLDIPVYLHPAAPSPDNRKYFVGNYDPDFTQIVSTNVWGWHSDVAVHVLRLYACGIFDKLPRLKLVIGHMGEMMPFMIERINARLMESWGTLDRGFLTVWAKNIWITTSGMWYLGPMACLLRAVKVDRILYSVDYPLERHSYGLKFIHDLEESGMVTKEELEMILYKNAEKLLRVKAKV